MSKVTKTDADARWVRAESKVSCEVTTATPSGPTSDSSGHRWARAGRIVVVVLGVFALIALATVFYVGAKALRVSQALDSAHSVLASYPLALGHADRGDQLMASRRLHDDAESIEHATDDPIWRLYEKLPVFGARLRVARETGSVLAAFQRDGLQPLAAAADDVNDLVPAGGRVSLPALKRLRPVIDQLSTAAAAASRSATRIDDSGASADLQSGVAEMRAGFGRVSSVASSLKNIAPLLNGMLGGEGTRDYLVALQTPVQLSAGGGKVAAVSLVQVRAGHIQIVQTATASSFGTLSEAGTLETGRAGDVPKVGPGWVSLYGDPSALNMADAASSPDFPITAQLIRAQWRARYGGRVDGVVMLNAVAFDAVLQATGAVRTSGGEDLAHGSAVAALEGDGSSSGQAGVARAKLSGRALAALIEAMRQGRGDPAAYMASLAPLANSRQLSVWSAHTKEERYATRFPIGGQLPGDDAQLTALGVYADSTIRPASNEAVLTRVHVVADRCSARPRYTVRVDLPGASALGDPQSSRKDVGLQLYGPAAGKLLSLRVGKKLVASGGDPAADRPLHGVRAVVRGRPVAELTVPLQEGSTAVTAVFSGTSQDAGRMSIQLTPTSTSSSADVVLATCP